MHLKQLQKEQFKKQKKQRVIEFEKNPDKITTVSKTSPKNNIEANEQEILRERYISPELRHKIINDLRLKEEIIIIIIK